MSSKSLRLATGGCFLGSALLMNIPFARLMSTFGYPGILRLPPGQILTRFHQGGSALVWTWLALVWVGFPLLAGIALLPQAVGWNGALARFATRLGWAGALFQMVGLLRWVFVVPFLADAYAVALPGSVQGIALETVFQAVHRYGGVVLGEHLGQAFTVGWMVLSGVALIRAGQARWLGVFGIASGSVYSLAQSELLATAIPGFPVVAKAGMIGGTAWMAWILALGTWLVATSLRKGPQDRKEDRT